MHDKILISESEQLNMMCNVVVLDLSASHMPAH